MAPSKGKTKTPAAAAALKKAAAGSKTTGETELHYPSAAPVRVVSKTYLDVRQVRRIGIRLGLVGLLRDRVLRQWRAPRGRAISCDAVGGRVHSQVESPHRRISLHNGAPQVHHG